MQIEFLPKQDGFFLAKGTCISYIEVSEFLFMIHAYGIHSIVLLGRLCGTNRYFNDYCLLGCEAFGYNTLPLPLGYFSVLKMEAFLPCHMVPHSRSVSCHSCYQQKLISHRVLFWPLELSINLVLHFNRPYSNRMNFDQHF